MVVFNQPIFKFPNLIEPGSVNEVKIKFLGDPGNIIKCQPMCGCTANCEATSDGYIVANYTDDVGSKILSQKSIEEIKKIYPTGSVEFSKGLRIFLNDGQNLYEQEGMNQVFNKKKKYIDLKINGRVRLF